MGVEAFHNSGLNKVDLRSLRMSGSRLFADCNNLSDVTLYELNPLSRRMFSNTAIKNIVIPQENIPSYIFADCKMLESVTFTNTNLNVDFPVKVIEVSSSSNFDHGYSVPVKSTV